MGSLPSELHRLLARYLYGITLGFLFTGLIVHGLGTWRPDFFSVHGDRIFAIHWTLATILFFLARFVSVVNYRNRHHDYLDGAVAGLILVAVVVHVVHTFRLGGANGAEVFAVLHWGTAFLSLTFATILRSIGARNPIRKPTAVAQPVRQD